MASDRYKQAFVRGFEPNQLRREQTKIKVWRRLGDLTTPTRQTLIDRIKSKIQKIRTSTVPRCMRCADHGHVAKNCPNKLVCFACNQLGHKAIECREIKTLSPAPSSRHNLDPHNRLPQQTLVPRSQQILDPRFTLAELDSQTEKEEDDTMRVIGPIFHASPASENLEQTFQRSFLLEDEAHWGEDRISQALFRLMPHHEWIVRTFDD